MTYDPCAKQINSFRKEHFFLSNFYPRTIVYRRKEYASAEHLYQALKTTSRAQHEIVRLAPTPAEAKRRGKLVQMRNDFDRVGTMRYVLRAKFEKDVDLTSRLLATGRIELVEGNTWGDRFWGVCNGSGMNWLGRLLMAQRERCRKTWVSP